MVLRWLAAFVLFGWTANARADSEFGVDSTAWNGLSELAEIADSDARALERPSVIEISALGADDALLIIHPTGDLPVTALTEFLRRGGRVAIADDRGSADQVLDVFGITRDQPNANAEATSIRENSALLVAQPAGGHALTLDVRAVVTNHSASLRHAQLEPVFTFGDGSALILAGAVGQGRLIAIADSSVLINNMLELEGNRQLARNLLAYLREDHPGRLILAIGSTPLSAGSADRLHAPIDQLRALMRRFKSVELPPPVVAFAGWMVCAFAFLLAGSQVHLKSPYARSALFARSPTIAGFAGRIAYFRRNQRNLTQPLMAFKIELEAELLHRLGVGKRLLLGDVVDELVRRGASSEDVARVRELLIALDQVATQDEHGGEPPFVSAGTFRDMVASGERILAGIARQG